MKEIDRIQNEIIDEFSLLQGDMESTIFYIMDLGNKLPLLDDKYKVEENLVKGCQSKVWLTTKFENGRAYFMADSNTDITKGLISLLIRLWNGRTPKEILQSDLFFIHRIGMDKVIGSQRSNGFASMIRQMKQYAFGYQHINAD